MFRDLKARRADALPEGGKTLSPMALEATPKKCELYSKSH